MTTIVSVVIALLLWFIWRQLQTIADALTGLYAVARKRDVTRGGNDAA